jgi:hypothetical protein
MAERGNKPSFILYVFLICEASWIKRSTLRYDMHHNEDLSYSQVRKILGVYWKYKLGSRMLHYYLNTQPYTRWRPKPDIKRTVSLIWTHIQAMLP